jgi:hypothetical protein
VSYSPPAPFALHYDERYYLIPSVTCRLGFQGSVQLSISSVAGARSTASGPERCGFGGSAFVTVVSQHGIVGYQYLIERSSAAGWKRVSG